MRQGEQEENVNQQLVNEETWQRKRQRKLKKKKQDTYQTCKGEKETKKGDEAVIDIKEKRQLK